MSRTLVNSEIFVPIIQLLTNLDIYSYKLQRFLRKKDYSQSTEMRSENMTSPKVSIQGKILCLQDFTVHKTLNWFFFVMVFRNLELCCLERRHKVAGNKNFKWQLK